MQSLDHARTCFYGRCTPLISGASDAYELLSPLVLRIYRQTLRIERRSTFPLTMLCSEANVLLNVRLWGLVWVGAASLWGSFASRVRSLRPRRPVLVPASSLSRSRPIVNCCECC